MAAQVVALGVLRVDVRETKKGVFGPADSEEKEIYLALVGLDEKTDDETGHLQGAYAAKAV